jgi:hypothetical protein
MKHTSTQRVRVPFKMCLVLFLTIFSMMFTKTSSAHNVLYYTPPCFLQGTTATVGVQIANAGSGSYFHWQFRTSTSGTWTYLSNGNNTINGRTFLVSNASFTGTANYPSGGAQLNPLLTIANVGSPAYTTQLDNVQFRVLMTDGQDPQAHPTVDIWGGEEYNNPFEAKYITLLSRLASTPCYTICTDNRLVVDPANPTLATYYGGFEMGGGSATDNFSTASATTCVTTKASTGLAQWTSNIAVGVAPPSSSYRVLNNPDSMYNGFTAFAPHTGKQMMVVYNNTTASNLIWYRTIATTGNNYYQGTMTISFWVAKVNATNPTVTVEVKGAAATGTPCTFTSITDGSASLSLTTAMGTGNWQKVSLTFNVPIHSYKKLQFGIRTTNTNVSLALDDICLNEPVAGTLPIIMTPLKGAYSNGVSHLTWSTLQESNSSHFEIERSSDGVNFTSIGTVSAKGLSDKQTDYSFNDVKVNAGTNYYRLRAVDKDANFKNSNIVALEVKIKGTNVTGIYPNPFVDKVNIAVSSEISGQAVIRLFDNTGKLIATQQSSISKGVNNVAIDNLIALAKGFYMVKVQIGDMVVTQKLIK